MVEEVVVFEGWICRRRDMGRSVLGCATWRDVSIEKIES